MTKAKKTYALLFGSIILLFTALCLLIYVTYGWFMNQKKMTTVTWIKTPIILTIGAGNHHDIQYLDMGDIDVEASRSKDYVFCVYGYPIDNYSLQLAYTTNIPLTYTVYRANHLPENEKDAVEFVYTTKNAAGQETLQREYFKVSNTNTTPVITGLPLKDLDHPAEHQSHHMSYGDDTGTNSLPVAMVQKNAEPLYWLAEEEGTNALKPLNTDVVNEDGEQAFLDYFILHVEWPEGTMNDKETDIVYLTASR